MPKKPTLYHQLLDLAYSLSAAVEKGKVYTDTTNGTLYSHEATTTEDFFLKQAVAIIDLEVFTPLSAHASKLLLNIIREMKMNNIFYISGPVDSNMRRSIAELKRQEILLVTERTELYIVNPFKIRRGKPMASIMASLHHYHKDNTVFKLEDLRPPKRALIANGK